MPGTARLFDMDEDELKEFRVQKLATEQVEVLRDSSVPAVDVAAIEDAVVVPSEAVPETKQPPPIRSKEAGLFSSSYTTPVELDRILIDKYGIEWLEWTPETLWATIRADFGTQISDINRDKVHAAKLLHVSDEPWRHWESFEKVACAFNNVKPLFDRIQELTVGQMLHALIQMAEIRKEVFEDEVLSYIAARAKEEGFIWLPPPLDVAQAMLDMLLPPEIVPLKKEIRERWDAFKDADLDSVEFKEDLYGVHLARLAAIDRYLAAVSSPEIEENI